MKFFIDTADIAEIRDFAETGLLDGVTTNPSLVLKAGRPFLDVIAEICELVPGPVSAEVASIDLEGMLAEGRKLATIAKNVAIKVPLTWDGLKACRAFADEGRWSTSRCASTLRRRLLAPRPARPSFHPFVGRLDDMGTGWHAR
jgi:transaldolase